MNILIAGASGFIGQALVRALQSTHTLTVLGRTPAKLKRLFPKLTAISWQDFEANPVSALEQQAVVINLCGENVGSKRWSKARKKIIVSSRIDSSKALSAACAKVMDNPPRLLNASAIGVYGLQPNEPIGLPTPLDEDAPLPDFPQDFLAEIGLAWEAASQFAETCGVPVVHLRFGVVLGKSGGALPKMARAFYVGLGGVIGDGQQPMSWVSLTDVIGVIQWLLGKPEITGPLNVVAPQALSQREFAHALGKALHRPSRWPTPAWLIELLFAEMGETLLLRGQHVIPTRLGQLGYTFEYPDIQTALGAIYDRV